MIFRWSSLKEASITCRAKVLSLLSVHQSPSLLAILALPPGGGWLVAFSQGDEILDDIKHE